MVREPPRHQSRGAGAINVVVAEHGDRLLLLDRIGEASSGASIFTAQFGNNSFAPTTVFFDDYTGDSRADIAVFEAARASVMVAPDRAAADFQKKTASLLFPAAARRHCPEW